MNLQEIWLDSTYIVCAYFFKKNYNNSIDSHSTCPLSSFSLFQLYVQ